MRGVSKSDSLAGSNGKSSDRWARNTKIAANMAQCATLIVVVLGYVYTVVPVFEKQRLAEDLAAIQLESTAWEGRIDKQRVELDELRTSAEKVRDSITQLRQEYLAASSERDELSAEVLHLRERISDSESLIELAEDEFFELHRAHLLGEMRFPHALAEWTFRKYRQRYVLFDREQLETLEEVLRESLISPLVLANSQREKLKEELEASETAIERSTAQRLLSEYSSGIEQNATNLSCIQPDPAAWAMSFEGTAALLEAQSDKCVESEIQSFVHERQWAGGELRNAKNQGLLDQQSRVFAVSCRFSIENAIRETFSNAWRSAVEPCEARASRVSRIVLGEFDLQELPQFVGVAPPTSEQINSAIRRSQQ